MRVLDRSDPRRVVLLLAPALLAAGAVSPEPAAARGAAALPDPVRAVAPAAVVLPLVVAVEAAVAAPGDVVLPRAAAAAPTRRAQRAARSLERREPLSPEERGRAALRALAVDPAALGYRVRFLPSRSGVLGTTNRRTRLITVYVQPGQSERVLRTTIAHEIGHALDFVHGTPARRDAYREVRRLPAGPWFPCDRCSDFSSPAGDFSEVFAVWLAGPGDFRGRLAGPPSAAQLRELDPLFRLPRRPAATGRAAAAPSPQPSPTREPEGGLPDLLPPPGRR